MVADSSAPDLAFLAFLGIPCCFVLQGTPCFFERFPLVSQGFGGFAWQENPCLFRSFCLLFPNKQGKEDQGPYQRLRLSSGLSLRNEKCAQAFFAQTFRTPAGVRDIPAKCPGHPRFLSSKPKEDKLLRETPSWLVLNYLSSLDFRTFSRDYPTFSRDFPRFLRNFRICSEPLSRLNERTHFGPTRNIPKRVQDTIMTFPEK